jgi:Bacterial regulatory proteins, tetR family
LALQRQGASTRQPEVSRREARAQRILDAAVALILRWGFQKITLDDVSRQARVAKGTMYLHCTLEPGHPVPDDALQTVSYTFMQYLNRNIATVLEQFQQEIE